MISLISVKIRLHICGEADYKKLKWTESEIRSDDTIYFRKKKFNLFFFELSALGPLTYARGGGARR